MHVEVVVVDGTAGAGGGGELVEVTEGLEDGDRVELVEVIEVDEGDILVEVEEETILDEPLVVVVEESVEDERLVVVMEVGEAIVDEPLADTEGVVEDESLGEVLEPTDGLADVTKVVRAAAVAVDDPGLDAGEFVAGSLPAGRLMIWPAYRSVALTPGFAASRDATGIPALAAMAKKVSPS